MKKVVTDQQKTTVKKVLDYIRRYWFYLGLSIVLAAVTVALTLYIPILTGRAVDLIITKGQVDFAGILVMLERMAVVILLTAAAQWIMNACNNKITYNVSVISGKKRLRGSNIYRLSILIPILMERWSAVSSRMLISLQMVF